MTVRVRILSIDGAQGEFDADPLMTIRALMNRLYQDRILPNSNLNRFPKQLKWNKVDLCETPNLTLKDINFDEHGEPIEFVPFGSVDEMFEAAMDINLKLENRLYQQKEFGDSLSHSTLEYALGVENAQIGEAGDCFAEYVDSLKDKSKSVMVPLRILSNCKGYQKGLKLPWGEYSGIDPKTTVVALIPPICLNRFDVVKRILNNFPHAASSSGDGYNTLPLHFAVKYCGVDMVRLLGKKFMRAPDSSGVSPLLLAAQLGKTAVVQFLMEEIAPLCGTLDDSVSNQDVETTEQHIDTADTKGGEEEEQSGLHEENAEEEFLEEEESSNVSEPNLEVVHFDSAGRGLLHLASMNGHTDTVRYLLTRNDTDINAKDGNGCTALHLASEAGFTSVVELLLLHKRGASDGIDVNAANNEGWSAIHCAAFHGCDSVLKLLCDEGWRTKVSLLNYDNKPAINLAAMNGHVSTVKLFDAIRKKECVVKGVLNAHVELMIDNATEAERQIKATEWHDAEEARIDAEEARIAEAAERAAEVSQRIEEARKAEEDRARKAAEVKLAAEQAARNAEILRAEQVAAQQAAAEKARKDAKRVERELAARPPNPWPPNQIYR